jgi:hypothetical protein
VTIEQFTVEYNLFANAANGAETPLTGSVIFTPVTSDDKPIQVPGASSGLKLRQFVGYIDSDGELKDAPAGDSGIRLWANDVSLGLESLVYRVEFHVRTILGEQVQVDGGFLTAPSTDTTVNLANVLESTGSSIVGITRQSGYAEDIIDAGATGVDVVKADSQADARAAIDAPSTTDVSNSLSTATGRAIAFAIALN